jgi:predicted glycosyltransferase
VDRLATALNATGACHVHVIGSRTDTLIEGRAYKSVHRLPGLSKCPRTGLLSLTPSGREFIADTEYQELRWKMMRRAVGEIAPDVIVTEMWPLGRRAFNAEMLRLIKLVASWQRPPAIVCLARDVPSFSNKEPNWPLAKRVLREFYRMVIVAGDERVIRLDEFWPDLPASGIEVNYKGYFSPPILSPPNEPSDTVIVTAGGALRASEEQFVRDAILGLRRSVLQHLPCEVYGALYDETTSIFTNTGESHSIRWSNTILSQMQMARCVIVQAGYNAVTEALALATPTVLVPRQSSEIGDEQVYRMRRFVANGLLDSAQVVFPGPDRVSRIAQAITETTKPKREYASSVRLDGAASTAATLIRIAPDK